MLRGTLGVKTDLADMFIQTLGTFECSADELLGLGTELGDMFSRTCSDEPLELRLNLLICSKELLKLKTGFINMFTRTLEVETELGDMFRRIPGVAN